MSSLQTVILTLAISYAVIGALLLLVLVRARLPWPVKAAAVIVTSAFYVVSFSATRGLLARLRAFCSSGPVEKCSASSSQTATSGVTCGRPSVRTVEIQKADAVRLAGAQAVWKDVGQRLLDDTCQQRTGRHEEDGCWPSFE